MKRDNFFIILAIMALLSACPSPEQISEDKEITSFVFKSADNSELGRDVEGSIDGTNIAVRVPYQKSVAKLIPTIAITGVSVSPASGKEKNFTDPAVYTVKAEDGSMVEYTVTVVAAPSFDAVSYYEEANRIGAGDFGKPDLFKIGDMPDESYTYSLTIAGSKVVTDESVAVTNGRGTITNPSTATEWNSVGDGTVTIELAIGGETFTYNTTKEQYSIKSWQDLQGMKYDLTGDYTLMNSIALPTPQINGVFPAELPAKGFDPVGEDDNRFTGSFDGKGHLISNFFINRTEENNIGLFGYAESVTIKNVGIEISSDGVTGGSTVGSLIGTFEDGSVENCYATGDGGVTGPGSVGGLLGSGNRMTITNSYTTVNVTNNGTGSSSISGGLVGSYDGDITNSYATGDVTGGTSGSSNAGGLVGQLMSFGGGVGIVNSYATGRVTRSGNIGGLVGESFGTITSSYWDIASTGQGASAGGGTGVKSADDIEKGENGYVAKDASGGPIEVFVGWQFGNDQDNPWKWEGDKKWPTLYLQ